MERWSETLPTFLKGGVPIITIAFRCGNETVIWDRFGEVITLPSGWEGIRDESNSELEQSV